MHMHTCACRCMHFCLNASVGLELFRCRFKQVQVACEFGDADLGKLIQAQTHCVLVFDLVKRQSDCLGPIWEGKGCIIC